MRAKPGRQHRAEHSVAQQDAVKERRAGMIFGFGTLPPGITNDHIRGCTASVDIRAGGTRRTRD